MLKELIEYDNNIKEEIKFTLSEKRKIYSELSEEGKKPGFKSMILNIRKK